MAVVFHNINVAHRSRFMCQGSSPNPLNEMEVSSLASSTNSHIANLDKLLGTAKTQHTIKPINKTKTCRDRPGGLNLPWILPPPERKSSVTPDHENVSTQQYLSRLQQLLSKTPENSPKNNLGSRWREYHGSNHWAGLLDPLDRNLRREIVRYGEFVQAAYHAFLVDPTATSAPTHVVLPDRSYKVTRSLSATSSVRIPRWLDNAAAAADIKWMTQRTSGIGYVAVCDDPREIRRMGRRDILIVLRGTATCLEWVENFRPQLVQIPGSSDSNQRTAKVACGFLSLFRSRGAHAPSLAETVREEVQRLLECYRGETLSITVTGHSLGAALSVLVADDISANVKYAPPIAVFSFGSPRVGNREFAERVGNRVRVLRVANSQDLITRVPGIPLSSSVDQGQNSNNKTTGGVVARAMMDYSHVGEELRVDTRKSPYLKPNADVACCHDLEAYLHLVDGFLASNCPFREDAKRSLRKLMNAQRSNLKLYTGKKPLKFPDLIVGNRDDLSPVSGCLPSPS